MGDDSHQFIVYPRPDDCPVFCLFLKPPEKNGNRGPEPDDDDLVNGNRRGSKIYGGLEIFRSRDVYRMSAPKEKGQISKNKQRAERQ